MLASRCQMKILISDILKCSIPWYPLRNSIRMTGYSRSPRTQKGAIVALDLPLPTIIIFQYNPTQLSRTLTAQAAQGEGDSGEAMRLKGPPRESITLKIELDAADQLEKENKIAGMLGLHPTLAALELLLYPKSALVIANKALAIAGVMEVLPPEAPLTLLVWGLKRVVPVRIKSFAVTETAFDPNLNPIQAEVDLGLDVLTYQDLGLLSVGGMISMAHQVIKEAMALVEGAKNISGAADGSIKTAIGG